MHLNNHVTVRFLKVLQRNGYDLHLSLKAEDLGINFSKVATSSDVIPRLFLSTISDIWWFASIFLSTGCLRYTRLYTALTSNTCMFFIVSEKLEVATK